MEKKEKKRLQESLSQLLFNQEAILKNKFELFANEETIKKYAVLPNVYLMSDKGGYTAYIGTNSDCSLLKSKFSGKTGLAGNVWYWIGLCSIEKIKQALVNSQRDFIYVVKKFDFLEAVLLMAEVLSRDILCASKKSAVKAYVGACRIASDLKKKFGGKWGRFNQTYYWIGEADAVEVFRTYNTYKREQHRFRREKIIFTLK